MKEIVCNLVKNKKNGQVNITLPKKKLTKKFLKELDNTHKIKIKFKGIK
jgi:hypothetical protein